MNRNTVALVATTLLVSVPLILYGLRPQYFAEVSLQPSAEVEAQIPCKTALSQVNGDGAAFVDFRAVLATPDATQLTLQIRPDAEPKPYPQALSVSRGVAAGVAQLGSAKYPLHQDEGYNFQLIGSTGITYLDGRIHARVFPVASASQSVLVAIGVLASVLQLLVTVWPSNKPLQPTSGVDAMVPIETPVGAARG